MNLASENRLTIRPLRTPAILTVVVATLYSFFPMLGLFLIAICVITMLIWALVTIVRAAFAVRQRAWKYGISLILVAVLIGPIGASSLLLADYFHLILGYPFYEFKILTAPMEAERQIAFYWGDTGFAGSGNSTRSLIHDPTGELAQRPRSRPDPLEQGVWQSTRHLIGDFFVVELTL